MIPGKFLSLEENKGEKRKDCQCDCLLNCFQLHEAKGAVIPDKTHLIGRNLEHVFKKCHSPADEDDGKQTHILSPLEFFEFQMPVPGKCHKDI